MTSNKQIERFGQFYDGLAAFFRHSKPFTENGTKIYLIDNTITSIDSVPGKIRRMLDANGVEVYLFNRNEYGSINKGAGEIQSIQHMKETIAQYQWFIHFEPRQVMQSSYFAESYF